MAEAYELADTIHVLTASHPDIATFEARLLACEERLAQLESDLTSHAAEEIVIIEDSDDAHVEIAEADAGDGAVAESDASGRDTAESGDTEGGEAA